MISLFFGFVIAWVSIKGVLHTNGLIGPIISLPFAALGVILMFGGLISLLGAA